jgi:hypothetical protein
VAIRISNGEDPWIEVSHPIGDKVGMLLATVVCGVIASAAYQYFKDLNVFVALFTVLSVVFLHGSIVTFRTRIVLSRNLVQIRKIRERSIEVPDGARLGESDGGVSIVTAAGDNVYSFPRYLLHGGRLRGAVEQLLPPVESLRNE